MRGTRRRLNRLSRGRYGGYRGYHADLAARYRQQLISVGRAPAPPEVADAFGVSRRRRTAGPPAPGPHRATPRSRSARPGSGPPTWPGTSLERAEAFGRPLYQEAEEVTGRRYATATDQISARQPSREEAELLQIRPDTPVLYLLHVAYDADHQPIEVAQADLARADDHADRGVPDPRARPGLPDADPGLALG